MTPPELRDQNGDILLASGAPHARPGYGTDFERGREIARQGGKLAVQIVAALFLAAVIAAIVAALAGVQG